MSSLNSSGYLSYVGRYGIPFSATVNQNYPTASSIESTMFWLDRVAEQHGWTSHYSSDPLIRADGFNWKRYNGSELEDFTPISGEPWNLKGYPIHSKDFWEHNREIIKFVGEKTLRHYDLTSGHNNSGQGLLWAGGLAQGAYRPEISGAKWGNSQSIYDNTWRGYGKYQNSWITNKSGELSFVPYQDFGNTEYMDRVGQIHLEDYKQYIPLPLKNNNISFFGPFAVSRVFSSSVFVPFSKYFYGIDTRIALSNSTVGLYGNDSWIYTSGELFNEYSISLDMFVQGYYGSYHVPSGKWITLNKYFSDEDVREFITECNNELQTLQPVILDSINNLTYSDSIISNYDIQYSENTTAAFPGTLPGGESYWVTFPESPFPLSGLVYPSSTSRAIRVFEHYTLNCNTGYSYPITFLPLSRNLFSPSSVNYPDYSHYIKSFTGLNETDTLPISCLFLNTMNLGNYFDPNYSIYQVYDSGFVGHACFDTHVVRVSGSNIRTGKLVAGFMNYDINTSGYLFMPPTGLFNSQISCIGTEFIIREIDKKIHEDDYDYELSDFLINSNRNSGDMGTISNLVDLDPPGNIFYMAYIHSGFLKPGIHGSGYDSITFEDDYMTSFGYLPFLSPQDTNPPTYILYRDKQGFLKYSSNINSRYLQYLNPVSGDWSNTSYGAHPSALGGKNFISFGPFSIRSDSEMYKY